MQTIIGAFDDRATAQRAVEQLVQSGFDRDDVHVQQQEGAGGASLQGQQGRDPAAQPREHQQHGSGGISGFFSSLFGGDDGDHEGARYAGTYSEAVNRGSTVVVVDAQDDQQAERAASLLHDLGAIDIDEREQQWRSTGWSGGATSGAMPATTGTAGGVGSGGRQDPTLRTGATGTGSLPEGKQGVLDVVQEELRVGKRSLDRGGVRVIQRVSQKPVRELVRLREEHAVVDRHPVDRAATSEDLASFSDRTIEIRESAEEAVVAKSARVVEEVRVGKEVREHEETIEDTVRRKDVDVERIAGQGERAVASDAQSTDRDATAGRATLTGKRKPGLDKPGT